MTGSLHPPIEPFLTGMLNVGGGHSIYWEQSGNPSGIPVLFCHGGPGSSCSPAHRRFFDPERYRAILFDQRGCGRSLPLGETCNNTTWDLVSDMEALRLHLGIRRWLLFGGSWGSTLALAYAQNHRQPVLGLVLRGVFLGTADEVDWFLYGLRRFLPEAWNKFALSLDARAEEGLLEACSRHLQEGTLAQALHAARAWSDYESAVMSFGEPAQAPSAIQDPVLLARVRVQTHYLRHHCFLDEAPILARMMRLTAAPAIIVQGRLDLACPPSAAASIASRWLTAELRMVENAGHLAFNPHLAEALVGALADFSRRLAV
jgi:proline iminopeptidase